MVKRRQLTNPFAENPEGNNRDAALVASAIGGEKAALEELIRRHQNWIYNIALRMVGHPQDAEDVVQEVLLKIITKLSTFEQRSSFRTWAYRIVTNHVLNMRKRGVEKKMVSFEAYWEAIDCTPDMDIPDLQGAPADLPVLLEEINIHCMMGMLLCLNRELRLAFILGEVFQVSDRIGGEILQISKDLFRQRLSRARKRIFGFMTEKCGLIDKGNPCHCEKKLQALIEAGSIDPGKLMFSRDYLHRIKAVSGQRQEKLKTMYETKCQSVFLEHPFQSSPDFVAAFRQMMKSDEFRDIFEFGN